MSNLRDYTTRECNFNLNKPGCLEFCSDPNNKCNEDSIIQHCVAKLGKARDDYPDMDDVDNLNVNAPECKCLLMGPATRLEKKLELVNHGNRACWSPYCRDGTSAKLDQLSKPSWWIDLRKCAAINFCIVDMGDTNLKQYGNSVVQINNCNDEQLEQSAGEADFQSTGENVIDAPDSQSGVEITDKWKLVIAGGIVLVLLLISKSSSKARKLEKNLIGLKKSIGSNR